MNQNDLKQIGKLMREELDANNKVIDVKLRNLKDEISEEFEVKMLNWKSEIINSVDVLAKEISDERELRAITSYQISKLEKKVGGDE
jgi:hypothetical protein